MEPVVLERLVEFKELGLQKKFFELEMRFVLASLSNSRCLWLW